MKIEEAVKILEEHNKWRRDPEYPSKLEMTDPIKLGKAIDIVIKKSKNVDFNDINDKHYCELDMRKSFKAGVEYERSCEYYSKRPVISIAGHLINNPSPDFNEFMYEFNKQYHDRT